MHPYIPLGLQRIVGAACALSIVLWAAGCTAQNGENAEQEFERTVERIRSKQNFAFSGVSYKETFGLPVRQPLKFEGFVAGDRLLIREALDDSANSRSSPHSAGGVLYAKTQENGWETMEAGSDEQAELFRKYNPMDQLDLLQSLKMSVEEKGSDGERRVLLVSLDSASLKNRLIEELGRRLKPPSDEEIAAFQRENGLTNEEGSRLKREMLDSYEKAMAEFREIADSLTATGSFRLGIDRASDLPRTMTLTTVFNYSLNGQPVEESETTEYRFTDYDRNFSVP
jgi:hypothetical protein